jgi:hypothetical protein
MMSANVIQLRQMLSERFPGARMSLHRPVEENNYWPTKFPLIDDPLRGGLPKGALTEIISPKAFSGSATLIRALLSNAACQNRIITFIDGNSSLEVTQIEESILSRLLWIRCRAVDKALQAADLILRDNNMPLVVLDLKSNPENKLRKIPATTWYRFQRLVEETTAVCIVATPYLMVNPAPVRITCNSVFSLGALERPFAEILCELKLDVFDRRQSAGMENILQNTA